MHIPRVLLVTHDGVPFPWALSTWSRLGADAPHLPVALSVRWRVDGGELLRRARALLDAHPRGTLLVSRRADVAHAAGAGLHLPAHGIPSDVAVNILPGALVLRAAHDVAELHRVPPAQAALVSPVREPRSHAADRAPLGLDGLRNMVAVSPVPVLAMGGLLPADVPALRDAGAVGMALAGAAWEAPEPWSVVVNACRAWDA